VIATLFVGGVGAGCVQIRAGDNGQVVAQLRERLKGLRELEVRAFLARRPVVLARTIRGAAGGAVDNLQARQPRAARGGLNAGRSEGGRHGFKQWKRKGRSHSLQDSAAREMLSGDEQGMASCRGSTRSTPAMKTLRRKGRESIGSRLRAEKMFQRASQCVNCFAIADQPQRTQARSTTTGM